MAIFNLATKACIIGTAAAAAFAVTAFTSEAVGRGNGTPDPTALGTFDKAAVGGRAGCEVEAWPYIAPECLQPVGGETSKPFRRV